MDPKPLEAFEEHNVTPKYLATVPPEVLSVSYYAGKPISPGEVLERKATLEKPIVSYDNAKPDTEYALLMIDPDLFKTDDPTGEVRHWLEIVRFEPSPSSATSSFATPVRTLTSYLPCTPGFGSGRHRYIFILAQSTSASLGTIDVSGAAGAGLQGIQPETKNAPSEDLKDRMGFKVKEWLATHGLVVVAANFMLVSADAQSALQNVIAGTEALAHKAVGK